MHASRTTRLKWILLTSSLVFLAFLLLAAFEENFTSEWSAHQRSYAALSLQKAAAEGKPAAESTVEIRQVYLEGLKRVDRCVTCHVAIDDPRFADAALPLTTHPGDILKHHPADKFGCTVCHQGQGRATVKKDAHGDSPHWPEPMLRGELIYTTCSRCHYENDLYGGQSDLYGQTRPVENITEGELASSLPHADIIARGKRLVVANGCLGCHSYRGRGGRLGPDITYVGDKNAHGFDFKHVPGERTVENWLYTHFKSPAAVVPNTVMPDLKLTDAQARDLAAYMLSLKRKSAPAAYTPLPQPVDETPTSGENLYRAYCSACHGADGVGAIVRDAAAAKFLERPRELLTPSLRNIDTLSIASDAYLVRIVAHGRPGTSMPAWQSDGGLSADEIRRIVEFIRGWEPRAADREVVSASRGDAAIGRSLYRANCTSCHGLNGEGGLIGVSLRSPTFLAIASDDLLAETILRGRPNTAMPSWRQFDNRDVSDLLAFLRSEQPVQSNRELVLAATARRPSPGADPAPAETASDGAAPPAAADAPAAPSVEIGMKLYRSRCTVCHGEQGEGKIGPSLNNQSLLRVVSDEFLYDTLVRGRPGTAMPAWRQLTSADVADLIAALRSWQTAPNKELPPVHVSGDAQYGQMLFAGACGSCHGPQAEGALGPQLSNAVFLDSVPDEALIEWISFGRPGTQMRPHLRGQQGNVDFTRAQIEAIVAYLRSTRGRQTLDGERIGLGYAPRGQVLYLEMCSSCHGVQGEGTIGPAIRNSYFLAAASDGFLRATIVLGRDGTEMRSMGRRGGGIAELRAEEIDDLIAYLRSHEDRSPISHRFVMGVDPENGREKFAVFCAGCHGDQGKGGFAPELNNAGFLRAATDGQLQATIVRGRRGTAMRAFGVSGHGVAHLSQSDINDVVAFIRQWSPDTRPLRRAEPFPETHSHKD